MSIRILALALLGVVQLTQAQTYPAKPIHIVVPFAAGGGGDIIARIIGERMAESFGQQVVIDNRGGAGGNIGAGVVAKAAPDGYTLLAPASSLAINPSIYKKSTPYDPVKDFEPITKTALLLNVLVVHPSVSAKTVNQLIALAKSRPERLVFASPGIGSGPHLFGELFKFEAAIEMVHVPFGRGGGSMISDMLGGQVDLAFASLISIAPFVKEGKLRALGIASAKRWPGLPDVPTIAESGFPDFEMSTWLGLVAPAGTRKDIVDKLYVETTRIIKLPEVRERLYLQGAEPVDDNTPEQFARYIKSEVSKYADIVKRAGIQIE